MSTVKIPKYFADAPEAVVWSFRHGVVDAMRSRGRVLMKQPGAYVIAPTTMLRLADRVRREWLRRHPSVVVRQEEPQ